MTSIFSKLTFIVTGLVTALVFSGCGSTGSSINNVGSGSEQYSAQNAMNRTYNYASNVYLDVAIPVFESGLAGPYEYDLQEEQREEGIWPQVRRLEANRFSLDTKKALEKTRAFGSVNVTPNAQVDTDLYVLGKIISSNTEIVEINVKVMDAKNQTWGERQFEFRVGPFFHKDPLNKGKNPYEPVFASVASWVYDLLIKRSDDEKREIENVSNLRYAKNYSPQVFSQYLEAKSNVWRLTGMPAESDRTYKRVSAIKAKDDQFIDVLQTNYETFYQTSDEAYSTYHKETYALAKRKREAKSERTKKQLLTAGLAVLAVVAKNQDSNLGDATSVVAAIGAASNLKDAIDANAELHDVRDILDESGSSLQLKVSPQVVEFENEKIELAGTAQEQYQQLRQRLKQIYDLEKTPTKQL
jgi:hypothetical protein